MGTGYTGSVLAPTPSRLFFGFFVLTALVFLRPPNTNFIFDEQEALLGNPYLMGDLPWWKVLSVDFWGRAPEATIGSYRPLPNLLWRSLSSTLRLHTPWAFTVLNLVFHAGTATLLARSVIASSFNGEVWSPAVFTTKHDEVRNRWAWLAGTMFCISGVSAEAVCGVVGLADVLAGFFAVLTLLLVWTLPPAQGRSSVVRCMKTWWALFSSLLLGLLSKETMLGVLMFLPFIFALRPGARTETRFCTSVGTVVSLLVSCSVLIFYVTLRQQFFPGYRLEPVSIVHSGVASRAASLFLDWFSQLVLPYDLMNNPLIGTGITERMWTVSGLFFEQIVQIIFPWHLVADYSYPREAVVISSREWASCAWGFVVVKALLGVGLVASFAVFFLAYFRKKNQREHVAAGRLMSVGAGWVLFSYLPISNALVILPTIRAERLLYTPTIGVVLFVVGVLMKRPWVRGSCSKRLVTFLILFSALQARAHALHYSDDVVFWRAASVGGPASAKAHLNLGVMVGARGESESRIAHTRQAVQLAPDWPMGQIYLADCYCRVRQVDTALPHYLKGLDLAPDSKALSALALQCIWDEGKFSAYKPQLQELAAKYPESWLNYFVYQLNERGWEFDGIESKYRPRRYNEAIKKVE